MTTAAREFQDRSWAHRASARPVRDTVKFLTPAAVVATMFVLAAGVAIGMAVLQSVIGLMITNFLYLGVIGGLLIYMHRTGSYWNVPFAAHSPRRRGRR